MDTSSGSIAGGGAGEYKHVNDVCMYVCTWVVKHAAAMLIPKVVIKETKKIGKRS